MSWRCMRRFGGSVDMTEKYPLTPLFQRGGYFYTFVVFKPKMFSLMMICQMMFNRMKFDRPS